MQTIVSVSTQCRGLEKCGWNPSVDGIRSHQRRSVLPTWGGRDRCSRDATPNFSWHRPGNWWEDARPPRMEVVKLACAVVEPKWSSRFKGFAWDGRWCKDRSTAVIQIHRENNWRIETLTNMETQTRPETKNIHLKKNRNVCEQNNKEHKERNPCTTHMNIHDGRTALLGKYPQALDKKQSTVTLKQDREAAHGSSCRWMCAPLETAGDG